jgi:predicted RNase H-like nuclease
MFVGLDGCAKGWVAVRLDDNGTREIDFLTDLKDCLGGSFTRAMIDIPIGLPDSDYRNCDLEGRKLLGENRSRLFSGARRPLLSYEKREDAHAWGKVADGIGVSCQLFCLLPKIRQVDELMTSRRQACVRESHPELIFQRLNGGTPLPSKKTHDGIRRRRRILLDRGFASIDAWLDQRTGTGAKPDDVLDACACAVAAKEACEERRLPRKRQPPDAKGLKMEIWF